MRAAVFLHEVEVVGGCFLLFGLESGCDVVVAGGVIDGVENE